MTTPADSAHPTPVDRSGGEDPGDWRGDVGHRSGRAVAPASAPAPATGNAARVARHRRKLAEQGLKQINVQVPLEVHPVVKTLAKRLRDGEDVTLVLFDLVADVTAAEPVRAAPSFSGRTTGRAAARNGAKSEAAKNEAVDAAEPPGEPVDERLPPRPPLKKAELKRQASGAPSRPGEEEELLRQVRQVLRRGGWRASVIRRILD